MKTRAVLALAACTALAACATVPTPLQGEFTAATPREALTTTPPGTQVRWGGSIVETSPGPDATCLQVIARPLGSNGRPSSSSPDASNGRFIACRTGFYDPAVFAPGREVTFIGRIESSQNVKIGEYDYTLPKVAADVVYLWPEVREVIVRDPYYPGHYPYSYPYWGPRWGGYWGWR